MRTPDHLAIKNNCRKFIAGLMAKHKLGVPERVVLDEHGWVNPCIFVNDNLVFRFNARDTQLPKFQQVKLIHDLLEIALLPTPR